MGMILRIASSRIVGQGDIVGRSGYFSLNLSANSVMRGRLDARRTLKSLVADLRLNSILVEKWKGKPYRLVIQRQRRIDGDLDIWEGEYTYRCILTNDYKSSARDIVEFYNLRGGKERIFDDMNNDFGWNRLPKSFMAQNTVFLLMTALIRNFYKAIMQRLKTHEFGLRATSRIKTFVFKFISVPAKWIKTSRRHVLNIYSDNNAYANLFKTDFG